MGACVPAEALKVDSRENVNCESMISEYFGKQISDYAQDND